MDASTQRFIISIIPSIMVIVLAVIVIVIATAQLDRIEMMIEAGVPDGAVRCPSDPSLEKHSGYENPYSWPECETKIGAIWTEDYTWQGGHWVKNSELTAAHYRILTEGHHVNPDIIKKYDECVQQYGSCDIAVFAAQSNR